MDWKRETETETDIERQKDKKINRGSEKDTQSNKTDRRTEILTDRDRVTHLTHDFTPAVHNCSFANSLLPRDPPTTSLSLIVQDRRWLNWVPEPLSLLISLLVN